MATLHGNIKLTDDDSLTLVEDLAISYNRRVCVERILKSTDGAVTIDLTGVGSMLAFYIHTTYPVTLNNGANIVVQNDLLLLNASIGASLTVQNFDAAHNAVISYRIYGVVA